jgi:hypothetical protein
MALSQADQDHIATAINWARQFPVLGIPSDISEHDCAIETRPVFHKVQEIDGPIIWQESEWHVVIRNRWVIDLNTMGVPDGPPRQI